MVPLNVISDVVVLIFVVAVALHGRQVEWMARLDFLWQLQVLNRVFTITDMDKIIWTSGSQPFLGGGTFFGNLVLATH
jgi:hypothetical protein